MIRPARPSDVSVLPAIERAAASLFEEAGVILGPFEVTSEAEHAQACEEGRLLVAVDADDRPVGFAFLDLADGEVHLEEVDVHPLHTRKGLGTALVEATCAWAAARGHCCVTLTTYRDVPWNRPFYARLGFEEISSAQWGSDLAAIVADEIARGLDPSRRCVMRWRVPRGS